MSDNIKVSIVVATYNGSLFIKEQVASYLKIISDYDEIIISDDASTDDTLQIVSKISDLRIRILPFKERVGYQKNFERAILKARGSYIFLSDQDDICLPERIANSLQALKTHGCVFGDAIVTDEALHITDSSFFANRYTKSFTAWRLFLKPAAIGATMAFSRKFITSALPFPRGVPHDQWLSVLAAARGQLQVIHAPLIMYRRHLGVASLTGLARKRALKLIIQERARLFIALLFWFFKYAFSLNNLIKNKKNPYY
jgi:glycosyltransferase involved in cell wall biosynthesis